MSKLCTSLWSIMLVPLESTWIRRQRVRNVSCFSGANHRAFIEATFWPKESPEEWMTCLCICDFWMTSCIVHCLSLSYIPTCCSWINFHCNFTLSNLQMISNRLENLLQITSSNQCTHQMQRNACVILAVHRKNGAQPHGCFSVVIPCRQVFMGWDTVMNPEVDIMALPISTFHTTYVIL